MQSMNIKTVTALATALQSCQQEYLAVILRAKFIQKCMCIYHAWVDIT